MVTIYALLKALRTTRPSRSLLLFVAMLSGQLAMQTDWFRAILSALTMLSIALAGFCANDIFDREEDRINHPERVLVDNPNLIHAATTLYIALFVCSVFLISIQHTNLERFIWALFFIFLSNYHFFKQCIPKAKNAYIGLAACFPASILDLADGEGLSHLTHYVPLFLIVFARELACDVPDVDGDSETLAKMLHGKNALRLVILIYLFALIMMAFQSRGTAEFLALVIAVGCFGAYLVARFAMKLDEKPLFILSGGMAVCSAFLIIN